MTGVTDHSGFLWSDLPGTLIAPDDPGRDIQRLSSVAHWTLTVTPASGPPLYLLAFHATPPVFDGPEDRNGRRNHDEAAFWTAYLDGSLGLDPPTARYVLLGDANLDPVDGEGLPDALAALLADPRLRDPGARSAEGTSRAAADGGANARHRGDPSLDTADWRDDPGPGNLRVDYILPSADWSVVASGILWPEPGTPTDGKGSRHGLVWVDLDS